MAVSKAFLWMTSRCPVFSQNAASALLFHLFFVLHYSYWLERTTKSSIPFSFRMQPRFMYFLLASLITRWLDFLGNWLDYSLSLLEKSFFQMAQNNFCRRGKDCRYTITRLRKSSQQMKKSTTPTYGRRRRPPPSADGSPLSATPHRRGRSQAAASPPRRHRLHSPSEDRPAVDPRARGEPAVDP